MSAPTLLEYAKAQLADEQARSFACKICQGESTRFDMLDLERTVGKPFHRGLSGLPVIYRRCGECEFIFTRFFDQFTSAQWQAHIYNGDYAQIDPEFAYARPANNADVVRSFFGHLKESAIGLDYGGGNGTTAARLRAAGWAYDCWDPFGANEMKPERRGHYNLCTTFEVFEHLPFPVKSLNSILEAMTSGPLLIVIGTMLSDTYVDEDQRLTRWPYAGPRNGHISLYSRKSLQSLANQFQLELGGVSQKTHFLSRGYDVRALNSRLRWSRIALAAKRRLPWITPRGAGKEKPPANTR